MKQHEIIKENLHSQCMNELRMGKRKRAQQKLYLYPPPQIQKPINETLELTTRPSARR